MTINNTITFNNKINKLISTWSSIDLHNFWHNRLQVIDVPSTNLWCQSLPEFFDSSFQRVQVAWLMHIAQIALETAPHIFYRVQVRALCWGFPPLDSFFLHKATCITTCVFWIIVLLKAVTIRKCCCYEWKQPSF